MRFKGKLWGIYQEKQCADFFTHGNDDDLSAHVFEKDRSGGYPVCECGRKQRVPCQCTDCRWPHQRLLDSTTEQRFEHELMRLHSRLDEVEQPPIFRSAGYQWPNVNDSDVLENK